MRKENLKTLISLIESIDDEIVINRLLIIVKDYLNRQEKEKSKV